MSKVHNDITEEDIGSVFEERFAIYGSATVKARAIPSVEDGLNPVSRRVLWAVGEDGYSLKFKKAAYYVGLTLARYPPHSDASVY